MKTSALETETEIINLKNKLFYVKLHIFNYTEPQKRLLFASGVVHADDLKNVSIFEPFPIFNNAILVHKNLIKIYKENVILPFHLLKNVIKKHICPPVDITAQNADNYVPIIINEACDEITHASGEYLVHYIKFNHDQFMVHDEFYHISELRHYLKYECKLPILIIDDNIMPASNLSFNAKLAGLPGDYLNFYVQVPEDLCFYITKNTQLPKEILDIEKFKRNKKPA